MEEWGGKAESWSCRMAELNGPEEPIPTFSLTESEATSTCPRSVGVPGKGVGAQAS